MARYLGPKAKLSRREGTDLFLKSARRSIADKSKFDSKPGQHGRTSGAPAPLTTVCSCAKSKRSSACTAFWKKQFRRYFEEADRRKGNTGAKPAVPAGIRLDNVVYRMGFGSTRAEAASWCRTRRSR